MKKKTKLFFKWDKYFYRGIDSIGRVSMFYTLTMIKNKYGNNYKIYNSRIDYEKENCA